jgi:tight adherence protein B
VTSILRLVAVLAVLAAAVAATAVPVVAGTADGGPQLSEIKTGAFPEKAFVLGLPETRSLGEGAVTVRENGDPVHDLTVEPLASGARAGVVILVDASKSMEGAPIVKAMEAARALATRLPDGVEVAVIAFNNTTRVLLPLTADPARIASALERTPRLAYNTHLYEAIQAGQELVAGQGLDVGSIVVLSDGKDVGSKVGREQSLADAKSSGARIFAVGLKSPQFDPATLKALADTSGGTYAQAATTDDLTPIFERIGTRLSNEYVVRYESFAGPGQDVYVTAAVAGVAGTATAAYAAPGLPVTPGVVSEESVLDRIVQSTLFAVLVIAVVVLLVGFGVFTVVRALDRRLERRMARFVNIEDEPVPWPTEHDEAADDLDEEARERPFPGSGWYGTLEEDVEIGRITLSPASIVLLTILASVVTAVAVWAITGRPWTMLLGLLPPIAAYTLVKRRVATVRREFAEQLPETLDVVSAALRSGHSLIGALNVAVEGAPEPSHTELGRALADERLGVPLDDALKVTAERMQSQEMKQVSLVAMLQREAGTNVAEVLDQVSLNVRNQIELRRLIRTLTAQGRMSRWIVSLLPVGLFLAIYLINPDYLSPLWDTTGGIFAIIAAGVMIVAGSLVIKRIVEIDA